MHVRGTRVCSEPDALMSTIGWALALNLCLSVVRRTFVATNVAPAVNFVFRANFSAAQESRPPNVDKFRFILLPRLCRQLEACLLTSKSPIALQTP